MNKTTKSSRLQGKDLMNIGIYSAIYCVIVTGVAMLGYIPIMMPMLCALVPLIAGVPFMLFLTKVKKFGMIWIMSIIIGIFMILTGMAHYALIVGFFTGLIAELIYKSRTTQVRQKLCLHAAYLACGRGEILFRYFLTERHIGRQDRVLEKSILRL